MTLPTDPILSCPNCRHAIKLTESLAAPLVAATRAEYERRLAAQTEAVAAEKLTLSAQQQANERRAAELAAAAESQQEQIARAVQQQVREQVQQQLSGTAKPSLMRSLRVPGSRSTTSYRRRSLTSSSKLAGLKLSPRSLPPRRPQKRTSSGRSKSLGTRNANSPSTCRRELPPGSSRLALMLSVRRTPVLTCECRTVRTPYLS